MSWTYQSEPVRAGVIGVGSMGQNHARIYAELPWVDLVGVADVDRAAAERVATRFGSQAMDAAELLDHVDVVSVVVPTKYHYDVTRRCLEAGVHVLVEKPFVDDIDDGYELMALAEREGLVIQVGHIERFNPAVAGLLAMAPKLDIISIEARRLGPCPDRPISDSAVLDLMIHDVDVLLSLVDSDTVDVHAVGTPDGQHTIAQFRFANDVVANLIASRQTQKKIRTLEVTCTDCFIELDYIAQSLRIHRHSRPEYTSEDGTVSYRDERITEQPMISASEPLRLEVESFLEAVTERTKPRVGPEDALRAVTIVQEIDRQVLTQEPAESPEVSAE